MKGTFFRSIWNLFARVGFSKTSTSFVLRAKKNRANKFQIKLEFVFITYKYFIATINLL